MRLKTSFVTNSSSVSFCGWGIEISTSFENLPEKFQQRIYQEFIKHDNSEGISFEEFQVEADEWFWEDYLDNIFEDLKISIRSNSDYGVIYISRHPNDVSKDKTINEIIDELQKIFNDFGLENKVSFISASWYDG